jgi:cytoskeletal protein CcmA (bactofilin family)
VERNGAAARGAERATTVIGRSIVIKGELLGAEALRIDGRIEGDLRCSVLDIGESGSVEGAIEARAVRVLGILDGRVATDELVVGARGRVSGEIRYERLSVAAGGQIHGRMSCGPGDAARAPPAAKDAAPPGDAVHVYIE